jgi:hypothetical protein
METAGKTEVFSMPPPSIQDERKSLAAASGKDIRLLYVPEIQIVKGFNI